MTQRLFSFLKKASQPYQLTITDRLPLHLIAPASLSCQWELTPLSGAERLTLTLSGSLEIECQRCLSAFTLPYQHEVQIALCKNSDAMMHYETQYECLLLNELPDSLAELVTDELHLSVPEKHLENCGPGNNDIL